MSWLNTPNSIAIDASDLDTDYYTDAPLPSPANTPYRTPQLSRKSSYQLESAFPANSPPLGRSASPIYQHPHHPHNRVSLLAHDPTKDETISLLDPRRFTPTLHANLVAEILSLRRELESKAQFIDHLENDLSAARNEQETATSSIASAQREAREVKRRLAIAENDTAVENIIQERDDAVEAIGELRRQVERLTKRGRIAEQEVERTRKMAERDAEKWSELRRELERRTHIAEGRLRMVLEEVAANDMKEDERPASASDAEGTDTGSIHRSVSDAASVRTVSRTGYRPQSFMAGDDVAERFGVRFSHLGFGQSLADELDLPEEDESDEYEEEPVDVAAEEEAIGDDEVDEDYISDLEEGMLTPMQLERIPVATSEVSVQTEEAYPEAQSPITVIDPQQQINLAEKDAELAQAIEKINLLQGKLEAREKEASELERKTIELSELLTAKESTIAEAQETIVVNERKIIDQTNQLEEFMRLEKSASKDVSEVVEMVETSTQTAVDVEVQKIMVEVGIQASEASVEVIIEKPAEVLPRKDYVSSGSQTIPPPAQEQKPTPPPPAPAPKQMASTGVQTDRPPGSPSLNRNPIPPSLSRVIPTIHIIPPPPTPPLMPVPVIMIDAFSQTSTPSTRTTSMQTDMIVVEAPAPSKPLPTLLPSALLASPTPLSLPDTGPAPSLPRRSSKRVTRKDSNPSTPQITLMGSALMEDPLEDEEEDDDDAGGCTPPPIGKGKGKYRESFSSLRPIRTSSLFPAPSIDFPGSSDDESINYSDNEYKTVLSAPKPIPRKQRYSKPSALPERTNSSKLAPSIRRNPSMLGSSSQAGPARGRTPTSTNGSTASSGAIGPPFPVPARFSSRKVTPTGSEKPENSSAPFSGNSRGLSRNPRNPSLRKSRSAVTLNSTREAQSPPPLSASTVPPDSPMLPPLPRDEVRSPAFPTTSYRTPLSQYQNKYQKEPVSSQASTTTSYAGHGHAKVESVVQQTSVVDAIAQTMVGEWMWKYVRRRKSFGVPDSPGWDGKDEGGGQRHKRWVWLAPYERAVMWSSRQPTSGSALLGKSGRKRMNTSLDLPSLGQLLTKNNTVPIQSVLDVKDDTPLPRGTSPTPVFNRSILILTPARALKFTACSKERHYVWLTALSFLSHSAQEADGLLSLPPPMPFEYEQMEQQQAQPTPTRIFTEHDAYPPPPPPIRARDSIRLAKSKKPDNNSQSSGLNIRKSGKVKEHVREDSFAMPPSIPRYPGQHVRRRSNTGSRPPNNRSFTAPFSSNSSYNGSMTTSDSIYYGNGVVGGIGIISGNTSVTNGSGVGTGLVGGWDAPVGTVRMAAFVDSPKSKSEFDDDSLYSGQSNSYQIRRDRPRKEQWGGPSGNSSQFYPRMDDDDFFSNNDPFRGF
ncbi:meiotic cell cortex C-terminal pleckstrin homology-domain-containing protein [Peziza echinospora]|nr:meiotic cell cortex C-terminal pleckstrin homology-domain-containing protein [Peziza echinospora]